jgi:hypothetical protein
MNDTMDEMTMHMTYYWGTDLTLWFDSWTTSDALTYTATLAFLFALSVFTEFWTAIATRLRHVTTTYASTYFLSFSNN